MDTRTQTIFEDAFVALGRLDNISVVMGFHPQYLTSFLRTQHYLLQMDGPLPLHYRHYIGIMVRRWRRHVWPNGVKCLELAVDAFVSLFVSAGGS